MTIVFKTVVTCPFSYFQEALCFASVTLKTIGVLFPRIQYKGCIFTWGCIYINSL